MTNTNDFEQFKRFFKNEKIEEATNDFALKDKFLRAFLINYDRTFQEFTKKNSAEISRIHVLFLNNNDYIPTKNEHLFIDNLRFFVKGEQLIKIDKKTKTMSIDYKNFDAFKVDKRSSAQVISDNDAIYKSKELRDIFNETNSKLQFIINFQKNDEFRKNFFTRIINDDSFYEHSDFNIFAKNFDDYYDLDCN